MAEERARWEEIASYVREYLFNNNPDAHVPMVINAFPGSGKSTNILAELFQLPDIHFIYIAPTHQVVVENMEFNRIDRLGSFVHFKSREKVCLVAHYVEMHEKWQMPIKPLCAGCDHRPQTREDGTRSTGDCEYYENLRQIEGDNPPSWAGVHGHITTYLHEYLLGRDDEPGKMHHFNLLVIEENPATSLLNSISLNREELITINNIGADFIYENPEQLDLFLSTVDFLFTRIGGDIDYPRLMRIAVRWRGLDWRLFEDEWDKYLTTRILDQDNPLRNIPKNIIRICRDIFLSCTEESIIDQVIRGVADNENYQLITLNFFYRYALAGIPMRIMGLDGTANVTMWERMFGMEVSERRMKMMLKNVYQEKNFRYPQMSWIYGGKPTKTALTLLKTCEIIVKSRGKKTLLVGTKKIKPVVDKYFKDVGLYDRMVYAWYYNLRSINYEECDSVILLCRPSPSDRSLEIYTNLSGWPSEDWEQLLTRDEMVQALHRIRPGRDKVGEFVPDIRCRERTEIFILSNEHLFEDGDVDPNTYFLIDKYSLRDLVLRGISCPEKSTRKDVEMEETIIGLLDKMKEMTTADIENITEYNRKKLAPVLLRLVHSNRIYYRGNKYGTI